MPARLAPLVALALVPALAGCRQLHDSHAQAANLALGRPVAQVLTSGDGGALVTDGRLAAEGAPLQEGVALPERDSRLVVDLGAPHELRALLLQAGSGDIYFVETSNDLARWIVVSRVAPQPGQDVLRTREIVLSTPVTARWLRVRSTTCRAAAVAEIQAFGAEPRPWPALDLSRPGSRLPLWPSLTQDRVATLFLALASLLVIVVAWSVQAQRLAPTDGRQRRQTRRALLLVAALALVAWPNFLNFHYSRVAHEWDVFHYYMGGKYLAELGYTGLYACALAVDAEDGTAALSAPIRDLRDNRTVAAAQEMPRAASCRARFSATRWLAFRRDVRYFREALGPDDWIGVRNDHGYNASPAWALVGGALARLGAASPRQITALITLDLVLALLLVALLGKGFGLEAGCVAAGCFGLSAMAPFGWTGGSILRLDWLVLLVVGLVALRAGHGVLGGAALGYSACLRVFPVFALAGIALQAIVEAVRDRGLMPLRRILPLAAGAVAACSLLVGASSLASGRLDIWREFAANSAKHLRSPAVNLVGLPVLLSYRGDARQQLMSEPLLADPNAPWLAQVSAARRQTRPLQAAVIVGYLVLAVVALLRSRRATWIAALLGLGMVPLVSSLSCYYYSLIVAFAALVAVGPGFGLALAGFVWLTNVLAALHPDTDTLCAWDSLALVALVVALAGVLGCSRGDRPADDTPPRG